MLAPHMPLKISAKISVLCMMSRKWNRNHRGLFTKLGKRPLYNTNRLQVWHLPTDWSNIAVHTSKIPELSPPSCKTEQKQKRFSKAVWSAHLLSEEIFRGLAREVIEATRRILATSISFPSRAGSTAIICRFVGVWSDAWERIECDRMLEEYILPAMLWRTLECHHGAFRRGPSMPVYSFWFPLLYLLRNQISQANTWRSVMENRYALGLL